MGLLEENSNVRLRRDTVDGACQGACEHHPHDEGSSVGVYQEAHGALQRQRPGTNNGGPVYITLEKEYARYIGTLHAVSCSSGTASLHLALMALHIGPGDEVIVPDFTMGAVPFAVSYTGATPVFVDCGEDLNINPKLIKEKITDKTKAIIAVHTYGRVCDMDAILKYKIPVIEDCAEAHGATYKGKKVGSIGIMGCFSFYKNKILHGEEGGIVTTNRDELAIRMEYLKNMAFDEDHTYYHEEIGYNYRITEHTAWMVLNQLPNIDKEIARRKEAAGSIEYPQLPRPEGSVVWVADCVFPEVKDRDLAYESYQNTRRFFRPMTTLPPFKGTVGERAKYFSDHGMYFIV